MWRRRSIRGSLYSVMAEGQLYTLPQPSMDDNWPFCRICPGRELALMSTWNSMAVVLQLFEILSKEENPPPLAEHEFEDATIW
jgi:hypothetical protein